MAASHLIQAGQASALAVRACAALKDAVLCATDPGAYFSREQLSAFSRVERQVKMTRYGGDCYLFAALALGFVDVVIEAGFHEWDIAALIPLVEGAGGVITDWQGGSALSGKTILASGDARVHAGSDEASRRLANSQLRRNWRGFPRASHSCRNDALSVAATSRSPLHVFLLKPS